MHPAKYCFRKLQWLIGMHRACQFQQLFPKPSSSGKRGSIVKLTLREEEHPNKVEVRGNFATLRLLLLELVV
jgi:hypothetical protein